MSPAIPSTPDTSPLGREIQEIVAQEGPIGIDRFMALALGHPVRGYYATRDPLGAAGDFTTAPEISQMFGELIGLWAAAVWIAMGRPATLALVELGPGRGTLMADAVRAVRTVPGLLAALSVHLVETSPTLRERQRGALGGTAVPIGWHATPDAVPPGPAIVLANEFLDALPIRQFVRAEAGWHERLVGPGPQGGLAFGLASRSEPSLADLAGRPGEVLEVAGAARTLVGRLADRLVQEGGAALFVDYGHARSGFGDTLQAVRRHRYADPLDRPGEVDLTAHVDFAALAAVAAGRGALVHGPVDQGTFLDALGIRERATRLAADADELTRDAIRAALERLTGTGPPGMGSLFKAFALSGPGLASLPGLPPWGSRGLPIGRTDPTLREVDSARRPVC